MLRHFGCSPNTDAVVGDLVERFADGRSRLWYWGQVLTAILISLFREVRSHKLLVFRGLLTGWAVLIVFIYASGQLRELMQGLAIWSKYWRHWWMLPVAVTGSEIVFSLASGWLVARLHPHRRKVTVLVYTTSVIIVIVSTFPYALITAPHFNAREVFFLLFAIIGNVGSILAILVGGGVLRSTSNHTRSLS